MEPWKIADRTFQSRLLVGTGKFPSVSAMQSALEASGTEIVTVALRRVDLTGQKDPQADMLETLTTLFEEHAATGAIKCDSIHVEQHARSFQTKKMADFLLNLKHTTHHTS